MAKEIAFDIFSDGGSQAGEVAASACIVRCSSLCLDEKYMLFLGKGTNNEAEISGGLLAFSRVRLAIEQNNLSGAMVKWNCDSQYVLKSATEYIHNWQRNGWRTAKKDPVKNQGLWRTYIELSAGIKVIPEHVRGHTGHPENEACDEALNWIRPRAVAMLSQESDGTVVDMDSSYLGEGWVFLDGQPFIQAMRESEEPGFDAVYSLRDRLASLAGDGS